MTSTVYLVDDVRRWSVALIVLSLSLMLGGCSGGVRSSASLTPAPTPSVSRQDPESVLRAYFAAWLRGYWAGQQSFMAAMYAGMEPEPLQSLHILKLRSLQKSSSRCLYDVVFEITVEGQGVSMRSGLYHWSYELKWDAQRQSWIITNYGAG